MFANLIGQVFLCLRDAPASEMALLGPLCFQDLNGGVQKCGESGWATFWIWVGFGSCTEDAQHVQGFVVLVLSDTMVTRMMQRVNAVKLSIVKTVSCPPSRSLVDLFMVRALHGLQHYFAQDFTCEDKKLQ